MDEKKNKTLTFRQLVQSLRDFKDQNASVMPYAKGAENPAWGIEDVWFADGILNLGQTDDEGDSCGMIADKIEECVPEDMLDELAMVRVGVAGREEEDGKEVFDAYGDPALVHAVRGSVVKAMSEKADWEEEEFAGEWEGWDEEDLDMDDDWFCKWLLMLA